MVAESLVKQPIVWVDDNLQLEKLCESWQERKILALDTEFLRTNTYYPIAGLIQVNDGRSNYLIDPKAISDFYPFMDLLDNADILKILHSCSEDLEVFQHTFGCLPKNMLDTQVAGAVVGHGFSVGFANLVKTVLDVELPKGETRSDWLQRPLSQSQIHYAALDVEYLYQLTEHLLVDLRKKQRVQWALDESEAMIENFFDNQDPDRVYLKFKSAWKLEPQQLAILKSITRWREDIAQDKDIPRNRVIKESAIYEIAQNEPDHISQLRNIEGLNDRMIRSFGSKIIDIVEQSKAITPEHLPERMQRPLASSERKQVDRLKAIAAQKAAELAVPVELLMRKKDYEALMFGLRNNDRDLPKSLCGWRKNIIGDDIESAVNDVAEESEEADAE